MSTPEMLHLDLDELDRIAGAILVAANDLTTVSRTGRLRLRPPAPDPISMWLTDQANRTRLRLALVADAAADELVRIAETVVAGIDNAHIISLHTQTAMMGLESLPVVTDLRVSPPTVRDDHRYANGTPRWPTSPDGLLSTATLLANGADTVDLHPVDLDEPPAIAGRVTQLATQLRAAISIGEPPARTLESFACWIRTDYTSALTCLDANLVRWRDRYIDVHSAVQPVARSYTAALAGAIGGRPLPEFDTTDLGSLLEDYASQPIAVPDPVPFPQLAPPPT